MKIAYFLDNPMLFGGAANNLLHQAAMMQAYGYSVVVVIPINSEGYCHNEYDKRTRALELQVKKIKYASAPEMMYTNIMDAIDVCDEIAKWISSEKFTLLHSCQLNAAVELASRRVGIPHIMSIYQIKESAFSLNYLDVYAHYHICDSQFYAKQWHQYMGTKSVCIRNSLQVSNRIHIEVSKRRAIRIVCVGVVSDRKNQFGVIRLVKKCLDQGIQVELTCFGFDQTQYADVCKRFVVNEHMEKAITFAGFVSELDEIYCSADVFICASTDESFPFSITEAMALGIPVITTPVAGVPELLADQVNAYVTEDFTDDALYKSFKEYLFDRMDGLEHLYHIIENAYQTYVENNVPERVAQKTAEFYNFVIGDNYNRPNLDIRELMNEVYQLYLCNYELFPDPQIVYMRLWYIYHLKENLKEKSANVMIWGAGKFGQDAKSILKVFFSDLKLIGYIDSFKCGNVDEYRIFNPKDGMKQCPDLIFVANCRNKEEIGKSLQNSGFCKNKNYFEIL